MNWKRCGCVQGYARARPGDRRVRGENGDEVAVVNVIVGDEWGEGVGLCVYLLVVWWNSDGGLESKVLSLGDACRRCVGERIAGSFKRASAGHLRGDRQV